MSIENSTTVFVNIYYAFDTSYVELVFYFIKNIMNQTYNESI